MNISQDRKEHIIEAVKALNFECAKDFVFYDFEFYNYALSNTLLKIKLHWQFICTKEEFNEVAAELLAHQSYEPSILEDCEYSLYEKGFWWNNCRIIDEGVCGWTIKCPHLESDCDMGLRFVLKDEVKFRPTKDTKKKLDILTKLSQQKAKNILDKLENL